MSKPIKELVRKELVSRFDGVKQMAVVGFTGVDAVTNHKIRGRLHAKNIEMTVVKNSLARQAFKAVGLEVAGEMLDGPCAVAYGADSVITVVRELLDIKKDVPNLEVKSALLDGDVFGAERIEELSKFPTREEAIAQVVGCVLSAGANLAGCLIGPGGQIASILKTLEEKQGDAAKEEAAA